MILTIRIPLMMKMDIIITRKMLFLHHHFKKCLHKVNINLKRVQDQNGINKQVRMKVVINRVLFGKVHKTELKEDQINIIAVINQMNRILIKNEIEFD